MKNISQVLQIQCSNKMFQSCQFLKEQLLLPTFTHLMLNLISRVLFSLEFQVMAEKLLEIFR